MLDKILCDDGVKRTIISRQTALKEEKIRYFTGEPCKNGHVAEIRVKGQICVICLRLQTRLKHKRRLISDPEYKERVAIKRRLRRAEKRRADSVEHQLALERRREKYKFDGPFRERSKEYAKTKYSTDRAYRQRSINRSRKRRLILKLKRLQPIGTVT